MKFKLRQSGGDEIVLNRGRIEALILALVLVTTIIGIVKWTLFLPAPEATRLNLFGADLGIFGRIFERKTNENVIISPFSIKLALAMIYLGAKGETSNELEEGLDLPANSKKRVGQSFAEILNKKNGQAVLSIANRFFVNSSCRVVPAFNKRAKQYFKSEVKTVNFRESSSAIDTINTWVERYTYNKIPHLLQTGSVDDPTNAILVNAVYFKGEWKFPFMKFFNTKMSFWVNRTNSVRTDIMHVNERLGYADLPEWDAQAIEMLYKNSTISMLLILPIQRDGLADLEKKLRPVDVDELSSRLTYEKVAVLLPKFKIEFSIRLKDILQEIGIRSIFEDTADLSGICQSGPGMKLSDIQHNAYMEVEERGSKARSDARSVFISTRHNEKLFMADHPFVFIIKSPGTVYLMGHVVKF